MHTIIGEKDVIKKLKASMVVDNFPDNASFNLIRWFWYMGSFFSLWIGGIAIIIGCTNDILVDENTIALLLSIFMFGFSIPTFGIVILLNPKDVKKLSQVCILILVMFLLWFGRS